MHDFGKLVYLDMHKTGSTTTSSFLRQCCMYDEVFFQKHAPLKAATKPDVFYFTTVRHPQDAYVSLFRYGCHQMRGGYYHRVKTQGKAHLYQDDSKHFNEWLRFTLHARNAKFVMPELPKLIGLGMGLQSARHVLFSIARPVEKVKKCATLDDVFDLYREESFNNLVIRNEALNDGLKRLSKTLLPQGFDQDKVDRFFSNEKSYLRNVSDTGSKSDLVLDDALLATFQDKERLLLENFYNDAQVT